MDDTVQTILGLDKGTATAKFDIKSAYKIVPMHPADRRVLGMSWQGVNETLGKEVALFLCCIADSLSITWDKCFGDFLSWLKICLGFVVIRATNLCLWGHLWLGKVVVALMVELVSLMFCKCIIKC